LLVETSHAQQLKNVTFKQNANQVRNDQVQTLRILDGALGRLRATYKPRSTALSKAYEDWKDIYNEFADHITESDRRIVQLDESAVALFGEWAQEAETISDSGLKSKSLSKLDDTKAQYEQIREQLTQRRKGSEKIRVQLRDRVLFIKHSLNAESLEVLKEEASDIESEIEDMKDEMEDALKDLNVFIGTLGP